MLPTIKLRHTLGMLVLAILLSGPLSSCSSSKHMAHGWTDLNHAKELDKKKGKRSKKYQKNVARSNMH